jgi:hypothetical protein
MERKNTDPTEYMTIPQWKGLWRVYMEKEFGGMYKKAQEGSGR